MTPNSLDVLITFAIAVLDCRNGYFLLEFEGARGVDEKRYGLCCRGLETNGSAIVFVVSRNCHLCVMRLSVTRITLNGVP